MLASSQLSGCACTQISDAALQQLPEFRQRCAVMHRLGYADEEDTVQLKVKVPDAQSRSAVPVKVADINQTQQAASLQVCAYLLQV